MDKITIGKGKKAKQFCLISGIDDMASSRHQEFVKYIKQSFEAIDPIWEGYRQRIQDAYNSGNQYQAMIEVNNYSIAIQLTNLNYDCFDICFCLLVCEKEEYDNNHNMMSYSVEFQKDKLEKLRALGLTRGQVRGTVVNFMNESPEEHAIYLATLIATQNLSETT